MSTAARRPSPALVVSVPPDPRGTAECAALAQAALDTQQLDMVFPGEVESNRAQATFQVKCLLDSGASACFVSLNLARKLRLPFQDSGVKAVNTAADAVVPVAGVVSFMLRLSGVVTPVTAHVLPSFIAEADLILGQDYHKSHSVVLDYANNAAECSLLCPSTRRRVTLSRLTLAAVTQTVPTAGPSTSAAPPCEPSYSHAVSDRIPGLSPAAAARLLRRHAGRAFVALVKPYPLSSGHAPGQQPAVAAMHPYTVDAALQAGPPGTPPLTQPPEKPKPSLDHVPPAVRSELEAMLEEYADVFSESPQAGSAKVDIPQHTIKLKEGCKPPFRRNYRLSPLEMQELRTQVTDLLAKGLISPSNSPFGAPVLFVPKPNGGLRFCLDYRALNDLTEKLRYPLPRIDDLLDAARGAAFKSSLDMAGGYHQIRIAPEDVPKTAFGTPFGHYEWRVLPMGLTNAPSTFQHTMNTVFAPYLKVPGPVSDKHKPGLEGTERFVLVYLDDVLCLSKSVADHMRHLRLIFAKLREHGLQAKLSKCKFLQKELKFLGHILTEEGVKPDPAKVQTLIDWEFPTNALGVMQFLGLANYFRKFIPDFSRIAAPLTELTKKTVQFQKGEEEVRSFQAIKQLLASPPLLAYPNPDLPYELISDASVAGCGAVLVQEGRPVAYYSAKFSSAERNYATGEQELLGLIKALKEWRCYLEGCEQLTLVTDHNPLTWFSSQPTLSRRQARWQEFLSRFHPFEVKYRPGATNPADPLSRLHSVAACVSAVLLAVNVNANTPGLLERIKAETATDPHFTDPVQTRRYVQEDGFYTFRGRVVVPEVLRSTVLRDHHSNPASGHFGWQRTTELIERQFWWPKLREDVQSFVHSCTSCQQSKASNQRPFGLLSPLPIPDSRWHTVTMDFITDLPKTSEGHDAILVFVDKLTKYVHLVPTTKTCSAEQLATLFIKHIFQYHGLPKVLISDRDPRFTSRFWKALCTKLQCEPKYSTAFHPQTDGQTERTNRVLEEVLRHFLNGDHTNWEELLPLAAFAMNNAKSASTGETPFYLNYGVHPRSPSTLEMPGGHIPSLDVVLSNMHSTLSQVKKLLVAAQDRQKAYADKSRSPHAFKKGQQVLLSTKNFKFKQGVKKLHPKYVGPYKILEMVGRNAAKLDLPAAYSKLHPVFHVSLLKEYREGPGCWTPPPAPLEIDGETYYQVERILATRERNAGRKKLREFLIKWQGYDDSHNSWEPESNLTPDLVEPYLRSRK